MRKVLPALATAVGLAALGTAVPAAAQSADGGRESSYAVLLNQDSFFGFYPSFNGLLEINEGLDFSFYGILWTKPAFGLDQGNSGDDLWTEFGVGVNLHYLDDKLLVKPQIGLTNGSLLSGGNRITETVPDPDGGEGATQVVERTDGANFADGIVPNITVNYGDEKWEAEFYLGYYLALRNRNDSGLDFLHYWANTGYRFSKNVSAGLHWEHLRNTRNSYPGGESDDVYRWIGPYVQFTLPKGFYARFTAGADIEDDNDGDFYKLNVGMTF